LPEQGTMKRKDGTTEEKIRAAAEKLFMRKGYGQTSVREIALEAGINLALMNYYFRSKEKLFELIMMDTIKVFFAQIQGILSEEGTSIEEKVRVFAANYIDLMISQPDLPSFVMGELRSHPESFVKKLGATGALPGMHFVQQLAGVQKSKSVTAPLQLFITLLGMTIFPFIARSMVQAAGGINQKQFVAMMEERKQLIPKWFNEIVKTS
jgi:AcrR family transcriptional regulator